MRTPICDDLGIEFPIFAFTHCRDVVVAVAKAGGFGVLGAVGYSPEQLEIELQWIDEHIGDRPYGVDIVIPNKYEGMDANMSGDELAEMLRKMVPQENLDFARKLLADHGVPVQDESEDNTLQLLGWTEATATPQVEVALAAPEDDADRERARHPTGRGDRPHPRRRPQGRGAVRLAVPGAQARGCGRRHHHRPGRRGRRSLRRGRLHRALAAGGEGGRAGARARRGRDRQRRADRGRARARLPGRVVGLAVADGRGVREHSRPAGRLRQGGVARHRAQPLVHRQALPHAPQRLDRRVVDAGQPRARSACRCSTWCRASRSRRRTATRTRPSTSRSTRSARWSGSSRRSRRPRPSSSAGSNEYLEATEHLDQLNAAAGV